MCNSWSGLLVIAWYAGVALAGLGFVLGVLGVAIPHWLNVREAGYQMGYADGQRHAQETFTAQQGRRPRKL